MRWFCRFIPVAFAAFAFGGDGDFRLETQVVPGGAELLTIFGPLASKFDGIKQVPLVSVLRDTLGDADPTNDRLRYIWVLTSAKPNVLQRTAAALPFFYYRPDLGRNANAKPAPILDMADTRRDVWQKLATQVTQILALDPEGAWIRSSTRTYQTNAADHRRTRLLEGLSVFSRLQGSSKEGLSEREWQSIQARLSLAGQTLGGLVDDEHLQEAYHKQRAHTEELRGHNWELLRQRAEANGLYFQPYGLGASRTHALLLIAREDLANTMHSFDAQFLGIENPYVDARLKSWKGITIPTYFDADGRRVSAPVEGGHARDLIPLALYSLEYPKVPLLLADFRRPRNTKRREMLRRATTDTLAGVLGISRWGNWPYLTGGWAYTFVQSRHGDPNNRPARLGAYSQTRQWLALDASLDGRLREELLARVDMMGVNPLEESVFQEQIVAPLQYLALQRYVADPNGLARQLERDRNAERTAAVRGWKARLGFETAHVFTFGHYQHNEAPGEGLLRMLDVKRKAEGVSLRAGAANAAGQ